MGARNAIHNFSKSSSHLQSKLGHLIDVFLTSGGVVNVKGTIPNRKSRTCHLFYMVLPKQTCLDLCKYQVDIQQKANKRIRWSAILIVRLLCKADV